MISSLEQTLKTYIFPNSFLRSKHDPRFLPKRILDFVVSLFREIRYFCSSIKHKTFHPFKFHECDTTIQWKKESKCLYVLVHGYLGNPYIWSHHEKELRKIEELDVFIPKVHQRGNCPLEQALNPLLQQVVSYIREHPTNPICIIGVSNGSRLATSLEVELRKISPQTAIKVSTIAGVHFGTILLTVLQKIPFIRNTVKQCIRDELAYGSKKACEILERVLQPIPVSVRDYEFWASTEDLMVPHLNSSLPNLQMKEHHYVVHGYGHNGIVKGVHKQQIANCETWRKAQLLGSN